MATGVVRGRQTFTNDGGGYSNQQNAQNALKPSQAYYDKTAKMIANYRAGLNQTPRTVATTSDGGGGGGGSSYNAQDEWASWWRDMQKYLKTLYEKEVRNNRENFESSRDQINLNRARNDRIFRAMSDPDSGRGMSIRARNNSNWINNLATARNTLANANDTSLANYHQNLANARSNYINQYMALMNSHHH